MTISIQKYQTTKTGDGSTTAFSIEDAGEGIYFADASEIRAQLRTSAGVITEQTQGVHFTVSGAGTSSGSVTFTTAPTSGVYVDIWRVTPKTQELDLSAGANFSAVNVMTALDRMMRMIQEGYYPGADGVWRGGDNHQLTLAADSSQWDGESYQLGNLLDPTESQQAVTLAYLNAQMAAGVATSAAGVPRTATGATTISNAEHVIAANSSSATYTIASGATWFIVSRSTQSQAGVTVVSADSPTVSVEGNTDGKIINAIIGPVIFIVDPTDSNNYITAAPFTSAEAQSSTYRGEDTLTNLDALTDKATGQTAFATNGRKPSEGSGEGTGTPVYYDGSSGAWISTSTGSAALT